MSPVRPMPDLALQESQKVWPDSQVPETDDENDDDDQEEDSEEETTTDEEVLPDEIIKIHDEELIEIDDGCVSILSPQKTRPNNQRHDLSKGQPIVEGQIGGDIDSPSTMNEKAISMTGGGLDGSAAAEQKKYEDRVAAAVQEVMDSEEEDGKERKASTKGVFQAGW